MSEKAADIASSSRSQQPGRRLLHHIPLRFVRRKVLGTGGQRSATTRSR